MNKEDINKIKAIKIDYNKVHTFFHCKNCIEQFLGSELNRVLSAKEYGQYEIGMYTMDYPDGTSQDIPTVWCKRCGKPVWDGRNYLRSY